MVGLHLWLPLCKNFFIKKKNHSQILFGLETGKAESKSSFDVGDLVWGPTKGFPAWPGKIVDVDGEGVSVMWFGEKLVTKIEPGKLQTLTEGLDAHHQARTKART